MSVLTLRQAILAAFHEILECDPHVFVIGVGVSEGVFGTLKGLKTIYPSRVIEPPLSEAMLTGLVHGAALAGMKPVLVHTRINFSFLGMDQIVNHIACWKKMFHLGKDLPILIRGVAGQPGWGNGEQHLGTHENVFKAVPGLKVIVPTTPKEAYEGITRWCFEDQCPTIYIDQKEYYDHLQDLDHDPRRQV